MHTCSCGGKRTVLRSQLVSSFHYSVGSKDQTQIIDLAHQACLPSEHLDSLGFLSSLHLSLCFSLPLRLGLIL